MHSVAHADAGLVRLENSSEGRFDFSDAVKNDPSRDQGVFTRPELQETVNARLMGLRQQPNDLREFRAPAQIL